MAITIQKSMPKADYPAYEVYAIVGGDEGGGREAFAALVAAFYTGIATDPIVRPMYPDDLTEAQENLELFLIQYFGGPAIYAEKRGHPRLRMRHHPFAIDANARDAWLRHMFAAVDSVPALAPVADRMKSYFTEAAHFLQNR